MRTLIDIPQPDIERLDALSETRKLPRAAVVREAIAEYLAHHTHDPAQAFGLWKNQAGKTRGKTRAKPQHDGLAYQRKVRDEW